MRPMRQCASQVLMVRPAAFGFNPETAATNAFQTDLRGGAAQNQARALAEFDAFVAALRGEGVEVFVAEDTPAPPKPDAIFPNNWVSFHDGGTVVLYPMLAPSRRAERRREIVDAAARHFGFDVRKTIDLSSHERAGRFLEGTGSLVLDHVRRIAYACRSERTHAAVIDEWAAALGYEVVAFDATDASGKPLYHTNVMLCIGERCAVVGAEAIATSDRDRVLASLAASGREIVEIDRGAIAQFAGNLLELASWDEALGDCRVLVMSAAARAALGATQLARLSACSDGLLIAPVPTIEALGGGSVRCMMAEVFSAESG
jgi:hypothetical protein